ncbi:hypothetical protein HPB52_011997 [Rhipicephalus sanguineus]|uniref:Uncharacterized protein n=1 Tax=Rhipicephalus sanguineus TaxID=34632 RepID=A0A9D4SRE1_RHISA|nr:hypothetical protein HPB52_011997 [Rhipicephalus sanguineus]
MHYLPELRKIVTRQKKRRPSRIKPNQPLDFHTERSRASTTSSTVHGEEHTIPPARFGNRLRPRLLGQRVAAAVPVHEGLRQWAVGFPRHRLTLASPFPGRREDVPVEGQTVAQRAARLFKTCDDVVTQGTDYVPRLRGYMRAANLHWPQHPATRDPAYVDVLSTMLDLSDKWGWPGLLTLTPEHLSGGRFEVHVMPSLHLPDFKLLSSELGPGSPTHRAYFETLYANYGAGIPDGVTFEEMLVFEAEVLDPLLGLYFKTPDLHIFERDPYDTSGTWERWMVTIARHYELTGNELVTISTHHWEYFRLALELIAEKEAVVELVIGWLCVQYTSWFANRQLISNIHANREDIVEYHREVCFVFTLEKTGVALFVPFVESVYTEPVRTDAARIARDVRRTVYQTLERATYPWSELGAAFHLFDIASAHDINARF